MALGRSTWLEFLAQVILKGITQGQWPPFRNPTIPQPGSPLLTFYWFRLLKCAKMCFKMGSGPFWPNIYGKSVLMKVFYNYIRKLSIKKRHQIQHWRSIKNKGDGKRQLWADVPGWLCQISWTSLLPELPETQPKSPRKRLVITGWEDSSKPHIN